MVIYSNKGADGWAAMESLFERFAMSIISVDEPIVRIEMNAFVSFGKGQESKAGLNYGDCFPYTTAKHLTQLLLYVGEDFAHTDIESVL